MAPVDHRSAHERLHRDIVARNFGGQFPEGLEGVATIVGDQALGERREADTAVRVDLVSRVDATEPQSHVVGLQGAIGAEIYAFDIRLSGRLRKVHRQMIISRENAECHTAALIKIPAEGNAPALKAPAAGHLVGPPAI
ncbi:hypothetical protein DMY87_09115 [Rhizobium wuzhouense]|uniref:Uncharacterized protein n=1 Tax=Rhizobium wuzhouense TaxID=1986026 RepID=A0ABX5NU88_9HYPH|nr:hypothetical protein DMY87_09115 [Rhizobium wuzhouense]